jgi:hypothetical protein
MESFRRFAYSAVARDASFAAVAIGTLMVGFSFHPPLALLIGANAALIFALGLGIRVWRLTEERVIKTEPWRSLERDERPRGSEGQRLARDMLRDILLRFAHTATAVAIVLAGCSLIVSIGMQSAPQVVAETGFHALQATALR